MDGNIALLERSREKWLFRDVCIKLVLLSRRGFVFFATFALVRREDDVSGVLAVNAVSLSLIQPVMTHHSGDDRKSPFCSYVDSADILQGRLLGISADAKRKVRWKPMIVSHSKCCFAFTTVRAVFFHVR